MPQVLSKKLSERHGRQRGPGRSDSDLTTVTLWATHSPGTTLLFKGQSSGQSVHQWLDTEMITNALMQCSGQDPNNE